VSTFTILYKLEVIAKGLWKPLCNGLLRLLFFLI
jgi:hypothetical protein